MIKLWTINTNHRYIFILLILSIFLTPSSERGLSLYLPGPICSDIGEYPQVGGMSRGVKRVGQHGHDPHAYYEKG